MDITAFRKRIRELYRPTGYYQKELAYALGLRSTALSNKLNGTGETHLKHSEVKQIIKILAQWEALTNRTEAIELLEMMGLQSGSFTLEEWRDFPLNKLVVTLPPAMHPQSNNILKPPGQKQDQPEKSNLPSAGLESAELSGNPISWYPTCQPR